MACATSYQHKNCSSQLDCSLCTAGETCVEESSSSLAGPREYRWHGLDVPVMMGKRRGMQKQSRV
jgi:hypothetical protein